MNSKLVTIVSVVLVAVILTTGAGATGFILGRVSAREETTQGLNFLTTPEANINNSTSIDREALFAPFWEAWDIVHQLYVEQPVDDVKLMQGAIQGMLASLGDKHTSYMDPNQYQQAKTPLEQEYEGIGAWVDTTAEFLTIISPMPGSPAEGAGVQAGDVILAVDGQDVTGVDPNLVLRKVLGPAGSKVKLTIRREGEKNPLDIEIVRGKITIPSVDGKMLDNQIAYVQIYDFAENTRQELRETLKELLAQKPKGLILDLRGNGGGYLQTAVEVASEFIDEGVILYEVSGAGERETFQALGDGMATKIPLAVLINEGSASASEILAGAIQDYGRGKLVGITSYGKGSVQKWIPLSNDQGAVRITVARWITPKERQINEIGLKPDVEVQLSEEDIKLKHDIQLEKAVEIILGK